MQLGTPYDAALAALDLLEQFAAHADAEGTLDALVAGIPDPDVAAVLAAMTLLAQTAAGQLVEVQRFESVEAAIAYWRANVVDDVAAWNRRQDEQGR